MEDRDKLIIVSYANIGQEDTFDAQAGLNELAKRLSGYFDDSVKFLIVPIREGETRVECINPKLLSEEEYEGARKKVEEIEKKFADFFKEKTPNKNNHNGE